MTSRDFITAEASNTDRIILYREGLFWKAYERSAYALCSQIRPLKPTRKVLKVLDGGDLISVGFPSASESAFLGGLERLDEAPDRLVVAAPQPIDDEAFAAWKASVPAKVPALRKPVEPTAAQADTLFGASSDSECGGAPEASGPVAAGSGRGDAAAVCSAGSDVAAGGGGYASGSARVSWLRRVLRAFRSGHAPAECSEFSPDDDTARRIVRSLKDFNLADKTPMECMLFISELKNMLVNR